MHSEDILFLLTLGALIVGVGTLIAIARAVRNRKRDQRRMLFRAACTELGMERRQDGWCATQDGVPVVVSWVDTVVGHRKNASRHLFTSYIATFEPPRHSGCVLYTGVEKYVRLGKSERVHVATVEHWNDLALPMGGSLWDVWKRSGETALRHVDTKHEGLHRLVCAYAVDPDGAATALDGALADTLITAAERTAFLWVDDTRLILYVRGNPKSVVSSSLVDLQPAHASREEIGAWVETAAKLAADLKRLAP